MTTTQRPFMRRFRRPASAGPGAPAHVLARRACLAVGTVCSLVAWATVGTGGLVSGLTATAVVVAFFWSGMVPLFIVRELRTGAGTGMALLLLTYTLRLALVLMALQVARQIEALDGPTIGVTIVASALTWIAVHVAASVHRRSARPGPAGPDYVTGETTP